MVEFRHLSIFVFVVDQMKFNTAVSHVDIISEMHTLSDNSCIEISDDTPKVPEKIENILLIFYPQQQVAIAALLAYENAGQIDCYLPPISYGKIIIDPSNRTGEFHTNIHRLTMPVGSGKTAIVFGVIALQRIPNRKEVIEGVDIMHATTVYGKNELSVMSANNLFAAHNATHWPCYFSSSDGLFPDFKPRSIIKREPRNIYPSNLYFIGPNLFGQIVGYCKTQITFPYCCLGSTADIKKFIFTAIVEGLAYFGKFHLIVIVVAPISQIIYKDLIDSLKKFLAKHERIDRQAKDRIKRLIRILDRVPYPSTYDIFQRICYMDSLSIPNHFARIIYDDYDSLAPSECNFIPALSHIFVSSTNICTGTAEYSPLNKIGNAIYARAASNVSISPKDVTDIMGLLTPKQYTINCTENYTKSLTELCLGGLLEICEAKHDIISKLLTDETAEKDDSDYRNPEDVIEDAKETISVFVRAINSDAMVAAKKQFTILNNSLKIFGIGFIDDDQEEKERLVDIFTSIHRTYLSQRMEIHLINLAALTLLDLLVGNRYLDEGVAFLCAIWEKHVTELFYPIRNERFAESMRIDDDSQVILQSLNAILMPNSFTEVCSVIERNPGLSFMLAPYILYFMNSPENLNQLKIYRINKYLEIGIDNYTNLLASLNDINLLNSNCSVCGKALVSPSYITHCCGSSVCCDCLYDNVLKKTTKGVQCKCCATIHKSKQFITLISEHYAQSTDDLPKMLVSNPTPKLSYEGRSVYAPVLLSQVKDKIEMASTDPPTWKVKHTLNNKVDAVLSLITQFREKYDRPPIFLLYNEFANDNDRLEKSMNRYNIPYDRFSTKHSKEYREKKYALITCESVREITGFNMEYLDGIIFYAPIRDEGTKRQIIGRGLRLQRNKKHQLFIYVLEYPSEKVHNIHKNDPKFNSTMAQ
jgi:hypothetical protein